MPNLSRGICLALLAVLSACQQPVSKPAPVEPRPRPRLEARVPLPESGTVSRTGRPSRAGSQDKQPVKLVASARNYREDDAIEYFDQVLSGGGERAAEAALSSFQTNGMRCLSAVRRLVPAQGKVELLIHQKDPLGGTLFVLRCRGVCDGLLFGVSTGAMSEFQVQDGTQVGYPLIRIAPPRMARNRDQGVVVWRGADMPAGESAVELLQFSRAAFAYGGGC